MGAMTSLLFAGLFPELVSHLISLDILTIMACSTKVIPELTAKTISDFLLFEKKHSQAPVYKSFDEVVDRRMYVSPNSLTRQSAEIIMRRATMDYQGGVVSVVRHHVASRHASLTPLPLPPLPRVSPFCSPHSLLLRLPSPPLSEQAQFATHGISDCRRCYERIPG